MSTSSALFQRRRGREAGASARYSVRRAGGGTSLMARRSSGAGQILLRRRALAARREDRISALPDELLLLILRRLDTRSALGTGSLSRRWAHLPRELGALDLRAGDMLPPRYHRWVDLYNDICTNRRFRDYRPCALSLELVPNIRRYERRAMRAFTRSTASLLEGPRRRVTRLSLEFFITGSGAAGCMNRLVAEAVDAWGVEDLEAVARQTFRRLRRGEGDVHTFPSHGLCKAPLASRLRSLRLTGCVPPPLHGYGALTTLVLQGLPESTPAAAYEGVFTSCPQLQTLHLVSCGCSDAQGRMLIVFVDAPSSQIRELLLEDCVFRQLQVDALPRLESLAQLRSRVFFQDSTSAPRLSRRNITMHQGHNGLGLPWRLELDLDRFLEDTPDTRSLIIRFTGDYRWIVPSSTPPAEFFLPNLRRLLVADVPLSWDTTWIRLLLEMAPCLETLHVHLVAPGAGEEQPGDDDEIPWPPAEPPRQLRRLEEFVVAGFTGTARQICLVRFVVGACSTALRRAAMFRGGHVGYRGHWGWEMVTQEQPWRWSDDDKGSIIEQIMDSSTARLQLLVLG